MSKRESAGEKNKALGDCAFREQHFQEAIQYYSTAIKADPSNHKLFSNRSVCHVKLKRFESALEDAEECVRLAPSWFKVRVLSELRLSKT